MSKFEPSKNWLYLSVLDYPDTKGKRVAMKHFNWEHLDTMGGYMIAGQLLKLAEAIDEQLVNHDLPITFDTPFSIEQKRLQLPKYEVNCNNCGDRLDLFDQALSYPVVGYPQEHSVYCHHCEHVNHYELTLSLTAMAKCKGVEKE